MAKIVYMPVFDQLVSINNLTDYFDDVSVERDNTYYLDGELYFHIDNMLLEPMKELKNQVPLIKYYMPIKHNKECILKVAKDKEFTKKLLEMF